jgi:hypothetical protein
LTKALSSSSVACGAGLEHDEGLGLGQALGVGHADHGGLEHRRVLHQRGFHLEGRHIDAADLEHVVAAAAVGVAAVGVADVLVAALGPAALEGGARLGSRLPQYIMAALGPWMYRSPGSPSGTAPPSSPRSSMS